MADLLDPRNEAEAARNPIRNSVWIPVDELHHRKSELPPEGSRIRVVDCSDACTAVERLRAINREAQIERSFDCGVRDTARLWSVNSWLVERVACLSPDTVVDLGCGGGRECVWLAANGWRCIGVDHLPDAVARAKVLEQSYSPHGAPPVQWIVADALHRSELKSKVVCTFMFWNPVLVPVVSQILSPGGIWLGQTFSIKNFERRRKPANQESCISIESLSQAPDGFECIESTEIEAADRVTVCFALRRR